MKKKSTTFKLILALFLIVAGTTVKAQQVSAIADFNPAAAGVFCLTTPVTLKATSTGATTFTWQRYKGPIVTGTATTLSTTTDVLSDSPGAPGYYTYVSIGVNADNCTSVTSDPVVVYVLPDINAVITANVDAAHQHYCASEIPTGANAITLTAVGSSVQSVTETFGYNYQWYKGTTAITGATSASYTLTAANDATVGPFDYTVQITYKVKPTCTAGTSNIITITVNAVPGKPSIVVTP